MLPKYTLPDGTLNWQLPIDSRDGADNFYESFYNWPLLYILGGDDWLLPLAKQQWEAVTRQLTELGLVHREYEKGYDQFHQGESYLFFYFLCLADPTDQHFVERSQRFAGFYMNEDPEALNYDPVHKIIRAPHNGSDGPRWGYSDAKVTNEIVHWPPSMSAYGLPYQDILGLNQFSDLQKPAVAMQLGHAMQERMGRGDVAINLIVTSLITNAYLLTGMEKYRQWVVEYVEAWCERADQNNGLLPDNVGLSGQIGEYLDGKWYGGLYGWAWPHGFYSIEVAALVAATNTYLLTQDPKYLELPRTQLARMMEMGEILSGREQQMSLYQNVANQLMNLSGKEQLFLVPYRYQDTGWFDYQPMNMIYPITLWKSSEAEIDEELVVKLQQLEGYDWQNFLPRRGKEDAGHERSWLSFLAGENPKYPEEFFRYSYGQVCRRLAQIQHDQEDLSRTPPELIGNKIHHWQNLNPVTTEALVQLTLGGPQVLYNGGLLLCRVRYFDMERQRPGLPLDVAALVEKIEAESIVVVLVNLSPLRSHNLIIEAGAFGEHQFISATYTRLLSDYPGSIGNSVAPILQIATEKVLVKDKYLHISMPPAVEIKLELEMARFINAPSYNLPWSEI